jgi:hypothetical protein
MSQGCIEYMLEAFPLAIPLFMPVADVNRHLARNASNPEEKIPFCYRNFRCTPVLKPDPQRK